MNSNTLRSGLLTALLGLGFAFTASAQEASSELYPLLPDQIFVTISVPDAPKLVDKFGKSPYAKFFDDPAIKRYLSPLHDENKPLPWDEWLQKNFGSSFKDTISIFTGPLIFGVRVPKFDPETSKAKEPEAILIGEIGSDSAAFKEFMKKTKTAIESDKEVGELKVVETDYLDETITTYSQEKEKAQLCWAVVGTKAVVGLGEAVIKESISKIKNPPSEPLPPAISGHQSRSGASDATLWVDFQPLVPLWQGWAEKDLPQRLKGNPFGMTVDSLMQALQLEKFNSVVLSLALAPSQTTFDGSMLYTPDAGIMALIAYRSGSLATPAFVTADSTQAGTTRFDFAAMWDNLLKIIDAAAPGSSTMLQQQLGSFEGRIGVSLRKDLLGNLGDQVVSVSELRTDSWMPQDDNLYAVSIRNEQGLQTALTSIRDFVGNGFSAFDEKELMGTTIYSFKQPMPQSPASPDGKTAAPVFFSHAVVDGWFLLGVGTTQPIEKAVRALKSPGATAWELPEVKSLLGAHPNAVSVGFFNYKRIFPSMLTIVNTLQKSKEPKDRWVNPDATPDPEVFLKYFGMATSSVDALPTGSFSRSILQGPKDVE